MTDITDKLREIENTKVGDDFPRCMVELGATIDNWGPALSAIAKEAREEIEILRNQLEDERRGGDRDL